MGIPILKVEPQDWLDTDDGPIYRHFEGLKKREAGDYLLRLTREEVVAVLIAAANKGDHYPVYWIKRIARYGASDSLLTEVDALLSHVHVNANWRLDPSTKEFKRATYGPVADSFPTWECVWALAVARFINSGLVKKLKKCQLSECNNFFIGGPRAKWCSDNCGSKHRVRNKRKRDKNRGISVHGLLL